MMVMAHIYIMPVTVLSTLHILTHKSSKPYEVIVIIIPIYRWENQGTEKLLPRVV